MSADVIHLVKPLDALAQRIRGAYERTERGKQEWIDGTLDLAAALAEARGRFPSNAAFGAWLGQNELDLIASHDRAALLGMAENAAIAKAVLQETSRTSWKYIWLEEIAPRLVHIDKTDIAPAEAPISAEIPGETREPAAENAPKSASTSPVSTKSPLHGWTRAEEVAARFQHMKARNTIGKAIAGRGGKEIWSLILDAMDAGFIAPNNTAYNTVTMRALFTAGPAAFCGRLDLTVPGERKRVREEIMPAALACRDAILANPERLEDILAEHRQKTQERAREAATQRRVSEALEALPADQREVMMFGTRLWPRVDHNLGTYDYDQLCAAVWWFRDADGWISGGPNGNSPAARAITIRLLTKWPARYAKQALDDEAGRKMHKVFSLVHTLCRLLEEQPLAECRFPPHPIEAAS